MARLGTRRSPWTRRRDRWIAVSIAGSVCIAGLLVWASSDSASTRQATATAPSPTLEQPREVPESFTELWRASSPSTSTPVAVNGTAVTGEDGAVTGRDARSGAQRWHYARELELCAISGQWDSVTVMHRSSGWCSEVTQLNADTGERTAQRNGNAESGAELIGDGSHLVATGSHLLNVWSEDLVRTMEYGDVPTIINPGNQPRPDCEHSSAAVASGHIAVIERCPDEGADRLSVLTTTNHIEDEARDDEPDVTFSRLLDGGQARIVALSERDPGTVAVAVGQHQQLVVYDSGGEIIESYELDLPEGDLATGTENHVPATSRTDTGVYWFTGSQTIAFADQDLEPQWTLPETLGPPTSFAGELLVPIEGGLALVDEGTGQTQRTLAIDRDGYTGPVHLATAGPVLLEQRGDALVALGG